MNWKSKSFVFAILMAIFAFACGKEDDNPDLVSGIWTVESVTGGIAGTGYIPNFKTVEFSENKFYKLQMNSNLISEGEYELYEKDSDVWIHFWPKQPDNPLPFEGFDKKVTTGNDVLTLTDRCCDLYVYNFVRATQQ